MHIAVNADTNVRTTPSATTISVPAPMPPIPIVRNSTRATISRMTTHTAAAATRNAAAMRNAVTECVRISPWTATAVVAVSHASTKPNASTARANAPAMKNCAAKTVHPSKRTTIAAIAASYAKTAATAAIAPANVRRTVTAIAAKNVYP